MQRPCSVSFPLSRLFGDLGMLWSKVRLVPSKPFDGLTAKIQLLGRTDWLTSRHDMTSSPATARWSKVTKRSHSAKKICDMQWNPSFYRIHPKSLRFHTQLSLMLIFFKLMKSATWRSSRHLVCLSAVKYDLVHFSGRQGMSSRASTLLGSPTEKKKFGLIAFCSDGNIGRLDHQIPHFHPLAALNLTNVEVFFSMDTKISMFRTIIRWSGELH